MNNYEEIVKAIVFQVDFGTNCWEYKMEVYKNRDNRYYPVLMKKDVFDILLTFDQAVVSESFWFDDGYTFHIDEKVLFSSAEECIRDTMDKIEQFAAQVRAGQKK